MVIDPYAEGDIMEMYPALQGIKPPDIPSINPDTFFRWMAFVYDPNSPMIHGFQDLKQRKEAAADEVGFKLKHALDHMPVVVDFLQKMVKSREWTLIVSYENFYDELTEKVNTKLSDGTQDDQLKALEKKTKSLAEMRNIIAILPQLYKEFFGGDEELQKVAEQDITPELVSKMTKKKTQIPAV